MKDNQINKLENKLEKLKEKRDRLLKESRYETSKQYRKERARRLIETGALAEKYFEIHNLTMHEREEIFKMFATFVKSNKPTKYKK